MFKQLPNDSENTITLSMDGKDITVAAGTTVASAALVSGLVSTKLTQVRDAPRAPYCMMGVCFECLMIIDGVANQRACQVPVADGMVVTRQLGKRDIKP